MSLRAVLGGGEDGQIAGHLMRTDFRWLPENASLQEIIASMDRGHTDDLPVIGGDGRMKGIVRRDDVSYREDDAVAGEVARQDIVWATYEEPIAEVLEHMKAGHVSTLPVVTARGSVEGVVVLDDLARNPVYADRAAEVMYPRGRLGRLGIALEDTFPVVTCGAALGLLAMALLGLTYGGTTWLSWVDASAALLAFIAAAIYRTPDLLGVALTAFLSAVLAVLWLFGLALGAPRWLTWLHFVAAAGFLILTVSSATAHAARPRRPRQMLRLLSLR